MDLEEQTLDTAEDGAEPEFKGRGLETYKRWWRSAEESHTNARKLAHRDRDWYDNFDDSQWDENEKLVLKKREQPPTTSNRVKRKVNFLCGVEQKSRSDPSALARLPGQEEAANTATKVLTFIEDNTRFDRVASRCFKEYVVEGLGACEVIVEGDDIVINKLDFDRLFYDPRSSEEDFSDARYIGYQEWFDKEDALELFDGEEAEAAISGSMSGNVLDEGYEDKPGLHWGDSQRERVRIACMYWKNGKGVWHYVYFTGGGILTEGVSTYIEDDEPACPIIAASAYVTRDNDRYGSVRDMISPQRELNYRKSMSVFHLKDNRIWSQPGVFDENASKPTEEMGKANGHVIANGTLGQEWGQIDKSQEVSINFQLMQEAKGEIDVQGPNAGLQGRGTEDQSGKAIALQQNAGLAEENTLFDTHNDWKLRVYRAMWWRAKQFWTEEKAIRITDDQQATGFIVVNQNTGQMKLDPQTGMPAIDPQTGQPMPEIQNAMAEMDVDIVLELGPDMITLQHEEFDQLKGMVESGIQIPPEALLQASQIRNKQDLIEKIKQESGAMGKLQQATEIIKKLEGDIQKLQQQLEQSGQQPAQLTPVDMAKIQDMQAKSAREDGKSRRDDAIAGANIEATKANTAKTVKEIMTPQY